jgi:8-oxo-dGTP pyrophosphatase MutT (NUDIX family)
MSKPRWDRLETRYVSDEGNDLILFRTRYDRMRNPRNNLVAERLVLESTDWVNIVAVTPAGDSVMVRQFRFGVGYDTLETPGGMVDPDENPLVAARRELLEETGFGGGTWTYLGAVEPNPAFHDHLCHHWLATDVEKVAELDLGNGEHIIVDLLSEAQIVAAVRSGEIKHALALSVLSRVYTLWPTPFTHDFHEE